MNLRSFTPRRAVLAGLAIAVAAALPGHSAVAATHEAPTLSLDTADVRAVWKEGWLNAGAAVRFSGSATPGTPLTAVLRPVSRPGVVTATQDFVAPGAGSFKQAMKLPARALPGRYRLRIFSTTEPPRPTPVERIVTIPAPPEGVIDRALVGPTRNGPWLRYIGNTGPAVTGPHKVLWVRFRFLYPPDGRKVELVWKLRWHVLIGKIDRRYANTIDTFAGSSAALPKGVWLVVLKIDGRIAKRMSVRLR